MKVNTNANSESHDYHFANLDCTRPLCIPPIKDTLNSSAPDIAGSYYVIQRAGQAAIDSAIQTNTAKVTVIDGGIARIPAAELIKRCQQVKSKISPKSN